MYKIIKDYERYHVYSTGKVYSTITQKYLKSNVHKQGYLSVTLFKNGKRYKTSIHRLVALHFIPNPLNKKEVNHIDGNPANNNVNNLEWVTPSENIKHAELMGLRNSIGSNNQASKLTEELIIEIRNACKLNTLTKVANMYNIHISTVKRVKYGWAWKHVPLEAK